MSWRPDSPIELANGALVCKAHHLVICGFCTVDYSFVNESDDSYSSGDSSSLPPLEPTTTGCLRFVPPQPDDTPQLLFRPSWAAQRENCTSPMGPRFIRHGNDDQMLIYTDGACLRNGQSDPAAGCAFVFRPPGPQEFGGIHPGSVRFRLERNGPLGKPYPQTSNRAELRAVIAALGFRAWHGEGWAEVVIATDSEYVTAGATTWGNQWIQNGWRTSSGAEVKNKDLWEVLFTRVRELAARNTQVKFWRIDRVLNQIADRAAKDAAAGFQQSVDFEMIYGAMC